MGIAELLLVLFVVLKLTGIIEWSWLWVLAPVWVVILLCRFVKTGKKGRKK